MDTSDQGLSLKDFSEDPPANPLLNQIIFGDSILNMLEATYCLPEDEISVEAIRDQANIVGSLLNQFNIMSLSNSAADETYSKEGPLPKEFEKKIKKMKVGQSSKQCSICLNSFEKGQVINLLPCSASHIFHRKCIKIWFLENSNCPVCRRNLRQLLK